MAESRLTVAIVPEVFHGHDAGERLRARLIEAREADAELVLLPELPLHPWVPAGRGAREADAEPPGGRCHRLMADAARDVGVGVHGGAIVRDPDSGRRFNRTLLFDAEGALVATYDKLHLPSEEGFWEAEHYEPGEGFARPVDAFGMPLGLQICSDVQRPTLCNVLGAMGAELILAPRATPSESYERWRVVLRADAITSAAYVVSVNRPATPGSVPLGGPSIAVAPDGSVLAEPSGPLTVLTLERSVVAASRRDYPGYLAVRAALYARAWTDVAAAFRPGVG
jgi:predicted amidohydrolase